MAAHLGKAFFDLRKRTPAELIGATCQAEVVHALIALLSLLPVALIPIWGAPGASFRLRWPRRQST